MSDSLYVNDNGTPVPLNLGTGIEFVERIETLEQEVATQATKDAEQDAAISAAQSSADAAQSSADAKVSTVNGLTPDSNGNVDVGGMPLGTLMPYTGKDVPAGTLRADGTTYTNMRDSFPEFYEWVVSSGLTVPLADYSLVEGSCGYYGLDTSTGTVRMPTLAAGVFGAVAAGKYGQAVQAGLPNITGGYTDARAYPYADVTGAFTGTYTMTFGGAYSSNGTGGHIVFDASNSNAIYGNSDTVTPTHVKYPWLIVVYNAAVPPSVAQAGEFIGLLDGKADVNLGNVTAEGKAAVVGWCMPDYSAGVTFGLTRGVEYTAPFDGFFCLVTFVLEKSEGQTIYINDVRVGECGAGPYAVRIGGLTFPVKLGDVIRVTKEADGVWYPPKGA